MEDDAGEQNAIVDEDGLERAASASQTKLTASESMAKLRGLKEAGGNADGE